MKKSKRTQFFVACHCDNTHLLLYSVGFAKFDKVSFAVEFWKRVQSSGWIW